MKPNGKVNEESDGLTYEKLKQYKGFENITEAEAAQEIEVIKKLAKILYYLHLEETNNEQTENNNNEHENHFRKTGT